MPDYSERHQIPTVQEYRKIEEEREKASAANASHMVETDADEQGPGVPPKDDTDPKASGGGQEEKDRIKAQMAPKDKPASGFQAKGER